MRLTSMEKGSDAMRLKWINVVLLKAKLLHIK